jgi:hypothetical protein
MTSAKREVTPEREREKTILVGFTRILLDQKMQKIYDVDSSGTNGR